MYLADTVLTPPPNPPESSKEQEIAEEMLTMMTRSSAASQNENGRYFFLLISCVADLSRLTETASDTIFLRDDFVTEGWPKFNQTKISALLDITYLSVLVSAVTSTFDKTKMSLSISGSIRSVFFVPPPPTRLLLLSPGTCTITWG